MFAATSNHPDFYDYQIEAYAEVLHPLFNAGAQTSAEAETAVEEQAALVELPAGDMSGMMGGMLPELPEGGDGYCNLTIDADSEWVVTGDSVLTNLYCAGSITDVNGNAVTIVSADGTIFVEGGSEYTITAASYDEQCDLTDMGAASDWTDYAMEF